MCGIAVQVDLPFSQKQALRDSVNVTSTLQNNEGADNKYESECEQEEGENEDEHHEDKDELDGDKEDVTEQDTEEKNEEDIRGQLMRSLTNKLNGKSYNLISYIAQDKQNLSQLLLQEASDISRLEKASSADMEFWKLAVSSTINLMHPSLEARLFNLFTEKQLDKMKNHMSDQKKAFESIATP
ncbi:hypothetical protein [Parasitella parasitica]|uniref:Uncharacterized protein n=1 Tax=Parasitella parasitica TaxID=35722 RepID=A0A0B7N793_9FUNG|nr:hypothetical protein [Parasitella parasitica]